ncbi:hypothetical protein GUJ93_ZPchr0040g33525 [Zizania palustris]|uniref:Uncharacterized protein n=1 Tax=Zizania palustris TaxID=103762 RepID=A0A8J5RCV8_ZIZPA|nr:hypothetical protein GUJ93_ZPchr0040g33525 [Zizania palustris]
MAKPMRVCDARRRSARATSSPLRPRRSPPASSAATWREQMSVYAGAAALEMVPRAAGLLRMQGLIGGKWVADTMARPSREAPTTVIYFRVSPVPKDGKKPVVLLASNTGTQFHIPIEEIEEFTPLIALAAADLALQAGIQSTQVRKITFTGSTAGDKKKLMIFLKKNSSAFIKAVQSLQVGNGLEESTSQGPLINEASVQMVEKFIMMLLQREQTSCLVVKGTALG